MVMTLPRKNGSVLVGDTNLLHDHKLVIWV